MREEEEEEEDGEQKGGVEGVAVGRPDYQMVYIAYPNGQGNPIFLFMVAASFADQLANKHLKLYIETPNSSLLLYNINNSSFRRVMLIILLLQTTSPGDRPSE